MTTETHEHGHEHEVEVHFRSLVTGERVSFLLENDKTLKDAWDKAYKRLEEARREGDTLHCAGAEEGRDLMSSLGVTLKQAHEQRLCGEGSYRYEIKGPSGGADGC